MRIRTLVVAASMLAADFPASPLMAQRRSSRKQEAKTQSEDRFLTGRPFTLEDLRVALAVPEPRLRKAIENRGLDFVLRPGDLDALRAAGASDATLELVRLRARVAPPPPKEPPKPEMGTLGITCEPAECDIAVNGAPKGSTASGKLDLTGLAPGQVTVEFRKEGYLTAQVLARVEPGRMTPAFARLEPDRATRAALGAKLYRRILESLGGEASLREARAFEAAGSADVFARDGKRSAWSLQGRVRLPDKAIFRIKGGSISYDFAFAGAQYSSNSRLKGDEAQEIETLFRLFRAYQLPLLMERIAGYKLLAERVLPVPGEDYYLLAEGGAEKITIALDRDSRPQFAKIETPSGLGSGEQILYSTYARRGGGMVPLVTHIRLTDADQHGLEVRLDEVNVNQNFTDRDFQIRRNAFR